MGLRFEPMRWRAMVDDPQYCMKHSFEPVPVEYAKAYPLSSTAHRLLVFHVNATLSAGDPALAAEALALARARAHAAHMLYRTHLVIPPEGELSQSVGIDMLMMAKAIDVQLLIDWLNGAPGDPALVAECARLQVDQILRDDNQEYKSNYSVSLSVVPLMGHGQWDAVRRLVEAHPKFGTDAFKPQRPTQVAYMLATDPAQRTDPRSKALKKAAAHLRANIHELACAHAAMFLHWMRIVEWREGTSGLTPRQVVLRAYAYMPDVTPPPEIAAEVEALKALKA